MKPWLVVALLLAVAFPARGADPVAEGKAACDRKDWPACARLYEEAASGLVDGVWMKAPFHATAIVTQTYVKGASGWNLAATHASRREERRPRP